MKSLQDTFLFYNSGMTLSGKLKCPWETAVNLTALCLQAELGEHELPEHTPEHVSEFQFIPNQREVM